MPALVLRQGSVAEEIPAEIGVYPRLRIVDGQWTAGGAGADLYLINGTIYCVTTPSDLYVEPDYWADDYAEGDTVYIDDGYWDAGYV